MIAGLPPFTFVHTLISLVGIATGLYVLFLGYLANEDLPRWTAWFLGSTLLTSLTGFPLPAKHFMPSHAVGILSVVILAVTFYALLGRKLAGGWLRIYVITAVVALYLNCFVLVAQLFNKIPGLRALAPTQTELPFKLAQGLLLAAFVVLGAMATSRFRAGSPAAKVV